jgi:hypothetical protein
MDYFQQYILAPYPFSLVKIAAKLLILSVVRDSSRSLSTIRTGLCPRAEIPPRKSLARAETGRAFLATLADFRRQRPCDPASPVANPRKIKDYSDGARNPELRRTAWWARQDSNLQPSGYERVGFIEKAAKYRRFCTRSAPSVRVWLLCSIGYSLVERSDSD